MDIIRDNSAQSRRNIRRLKKVMAAILRNFDEEAKLGYCDNFTEEQVLKHMEQRLANGIFEFMRNKNE